MTDGAKKAKKSANAADKVKETRGVSVGRAHSHRLPGVPSDAMEGSDQDRVVTLNVGGKRFKTLSSTLRGSPSHFRNWATNDFKEFSRDADGVPFIDRDPCSFGHILNFFRGYGLPEDTEIYPLLAEDAVFYNVTPLLKAVGAIKTPWRFLPGPGVSRGGLEFNTSSILGICGTEPLSSDGSGHHISFRLEKAEIVEVGVVGGDTPVQEDAMLTKQQRFIALRNTGELLQRVGADVLYGQVGSRIVDAVTVSVHFEATSPELQVEGVGMRPTSSTAVDAAGLPLPFLGLATTLPPTPTEPPESRPFDNTPSVEVGAPSARITFFYGKQKYDVVWPAPVPPLYFAVSMSGVSSVMITRSSPPEAPREGPK